MKSLKQASYTGKEVFIPRTGKKRAIVAVARKLIDRIRAAFHNQVNYQLEYRNSKAITIA